MLEPKKKDLIEVSKTLRDAYEKGIEKGIEKAIEKGIEKGRKEVIENLLRQLFMRRLGRAPTEREQQALAARARDPGEVLDAAVLDADALVRWLLDPKAK